MRHSIISITTSSTYLGNVGFSDFPRCMYLCSSYEHFGKLGRERILLTEMKHDINSLYPLSLILLPMYIGF
jgi:hypothetical protein